MVELVFSPRLQAFFKKAADDSRLNAALRKELRHAVDESAKTVPHTLLAKAWRAAFDEGVRVCPCGCGVYALEVSNQRNAVCELLFIRCPLAGASVRCLCLHFPQSRGSCPFLLPSDGVRVGMGHALEPRSLGCQALAGREQRH